MNPVEELLAIKDIRTFKARYFRFIDTQDWVASRDSFSNDALLDFLENSYDACPIDASL